MKGTAEGPARGGRAVRLSESGFRLVQVPVYLHGCRHTQDICPIGTHHHEGTCVYEAWLFAKDEPAPFDRLYGGLDDIAAAEKFMEAGHTAGSNHGLATAMYTGALARACIAIATELRKRGM